MSMRPVSSTSWLVAPRWTKGRADSGTAAVNWRTRGLTGLPALTACRPISAGSIVRPEAAVSMAVAASAGTRPSPACAAASVTSNRSIAASSARSEIA